MNGYWAMGSGYWAIVVLVFFFIVLTDEDYRYCLVAMADKMAPVFAASIIWPFWLLWMLVGRPLDAIQMERRKRKKACKAVG